MKHLNKKVSVVIPLFNEEENVEGLYFSLNNVLENVSEDYEIIFVDDGSVDRSFHLLRQIFDKDTHVKVVKFRSNFGKSARAQRGSQFLIMKE